MKLAQYCTFTVAGQLYGVEVVRVQEVLRYQNMTRVPLAPGSVTGLLNLRGEVVTAVDMRRRLDLQARAADVLPMNVVVRTDDGVMSLLVDEIGDVLEVDTNSLEPPPRTMDESARRFIRSVYKLKTQLLLILDLERTTTLNDVTTRTTVATDRAAIRH